MELDTEEVIHDLEHQLEESQLLIKALEAKLKLKDASKFKNVIDASPVPFALNDEHENITYLNPAFIRTFGYDLTEIATLSDWWPLAYPDLEYRNWVSKTWANRLETSKLTEQAFVPVELQISCKDGSSRTVMASAAPLSESYSGNHLVILYDITERKRFEEKIQEQEMELVEIFDHIPSMIFLKDARDLSYIRFNAAGEKMIGVNRAELIGRNDYDFFPKEQADFFTDRDKMALTSGQPLRIEEEPIDTPMGTRLLHTRKISIADKTGQPKYLLGISEDITEQKEIEIEKTRLQRELQQAYKMESLGQLTGGIAHDFNNLLAIVTGYTELGIFRCEEVIDAQLMGYLKQIQSASKRATSLVAQMLAFSRSNDVENSPINLGPIIEQDIKMLQATLPSSILMDCKVDPDLPPVLMNPTQLNQILMNLAINARDAMDGIGELHITLGWAKNLDMESPISHEYIKGDWVELSLTDTGTGIEASTIKEIFTPFYTTKPVGKGTGMGLSVIYGIMKNCNGHILVESKLGKGSRFRLLFPPLPPEAHKVIQNDAPYSQDSMGQGEHLLVVDDEGAIANLMGKILCQAGYQAEVLTDSSNALEKIKLAPNKYKILITDQTMPVLTGKELINKAREYAPELQSILCSGYDDSHCHSSTTDNNDFTFFQKPINRKTFIHKVHEIVNKK